MKTIKNITLALLLSISLTGCIGVLGTGAVVGTAVSLSKDERTLGTVIEDQAIELKAFTKFFNDTEINSTSHINVTSYRKNVLITGETPSEEIRQRIIDIVTNLTEVLHVYDELSIAAPSSLISRSSDTVITAKLKTKLLTLKDFDGTRVKIVTERGVVYLIGLVSKKEADISTRVAQETKGVQKIVKLFQYPDDE